MENLKNSSMFLKSLFWPPGTKRSMGGFYVAIFKTKPKSGCATKNCMLQSPLIIDPLNKVNGNDI